ncbi:MAG: RluA family pseudouridine synthase [Candidatus Dojkabacteria bacterium]|nr:MAG: RluA family pseudouridine synthase [Candidatus Dojkabacteria bacterium]
MEILQIGDNHVGQRIDKVLLEEARKALPQEISAVLSRTMLQKALGEKLLRVNGIPVKLAYKIEPGDRVEVDWEGLRAVLQKQVEAADVLGNIEPESGRLDIVAETAEYLVIDKPEGVLVHPTLAVKKGTIANWVRQYLEEKGEYDIRVERAGIVHRLDRDVSGVMVIAKTRESQLNLKSQFESHKVVKIYLASVEPLGGRASSQLMKGDEEHGLDEGIAALIADNEDEGVYKLSGYIGRDSGDRRKMKFNEAKGQTESAITKERHAVSSFFALNENAVLIRIHTGRMHQIRASLLYLGYRIVGDRMYGDASDRRKMGLRSIYINFTDLAGNPVEYILKDNHIGLEN